MEWHRVVIGTIFALAGCSGGGASDEGDALSTVSLTVARQYTETEGIITFDVVLETELHETKNDITLQVIDRGTGTATPGDDYAAFRPTRVVFPKGSSGTVVATVELSLHADRIVEDVAESIDIGIVRLSGPASVEVRDASLSIVDDPGTSVLRASYGATGTEQTLPSTGGAIALGAQANGAGPNAGTLLVIANDGGSSLRLGPPVLSGAHEDDFVIEVESASIQRGRTSALGSTEVVDLATPLVPVTLSSTAGRSHAPGLLTRIDPAVVTELGNVDHARVHGFPLVGVGDVTLELERVPSPLAPDAVLAIDGQPHMAGPSSLLSGLSMWRGTVIGRDGSRAFLAMGSAGVRGFVESGSGDTIHITGETPTSSRIVHESELASDARHLDRGHCAGSVLTPGAEPTPNGVAHPPPMSEMTTVTNCRLALETDFQLFERLGSSQAVTEYVTGLIAAISERYVEDAQTSLSIAYLGIHTTRDDGWKTPDGPGTVSEMLDEFQSAWSGNWPATADLAHFLSGADMGGGIAYVNVLCSQTFGFGVSAGLNGNIDWSMWSGNAGSFTWDFVVVAHELGHNFGASHTHEYCPPLDHCWDGTCVPMTNCSQGTLMSYCHSCGGLDNIDLRFHPNIANIMRQRVGSSCLGDALMQAGDEIRYRLRFDPRSGVGEKTATLTFDHDAEDAADPYPIALSGTSL